MRMPRLAVTVVLASDMAVYSAEANSEIRGVVSVAGKSFPVALACAFTSALCRGDWIDSAIVNLARRRDQTTNQGLSMRRLTGAATAGDAIAVMTFLIFKFF